MELRCDMAALFALWHSLSAGPKFHDSRAAHVFWPIPKNLDTIPYDAVMADFSEERLPLRGCRDSHFSASVIIKRVT